MNHIAKAITADTGCGPYPFYAERCADDLGHARDSSSQLAAAKATGDHPLLDKPLARRVTGRPMRVSAKVVDQFATFWLLLRSIPKTILFNLRYFPLNRAIRLPVLVSHRVWLDHLNGRVEIRGNLRPGMIHIGFGEVGIFDRKRCRSVWRVDGRVVFRGSARLGHGTRLSVERGAVLTFGSGFSITAESAIACRERVSFGDGVLVSWNVQVLDSDWHRITDEAGAVLNPDRPVLVGDRVWIGSGASLLKGAIIGNDCVVAAGSTVSGAFHAPHCLLAGVPARVIRDGIAWS